MFKPEFGEKCIIVHFLGEEKERKSAERSPEVSGVETLRRDLGKAETRKSAGRGRSNQRPYS
jgi:hypothetical protein